MRLLLFILLASQIFAERSAPEPRNFEDEYELFKANNAPGADKMEAEREWGAIPPVPALFPDVPEVAISELAEAKYRRAHSYFQIARELSLELDQKLSATVTSPLRDPTWWKQMEDTASVQLAKQRLRARYAIKLALSHQKVFDTLASIEDSQFRKSPRFITLRKYSMRNYIILQSAVGNYLPALSMLRLYREDYAETESAWPVHFYFYKSYKNLLVDARRDTGVTEAYLKDIRRKKNLHWLRAVDLKYGEKSFEHEEVLRIIRLEELGSARRQR